MSTPAYSTSDVIVAIILLVQTLAVSLLGWFATRPKSMAEKANTEVDSVKGVVELYRGATDDMRKQLAETNARLLELEGKYATQSAQIVTMQGERARDRALILALETQVVALGGVPVSKTYAE